MNTLLSSNTPGADQNPPPQDAKTAAQLQVELDAALSRVAALESEKHQGSADEEIILAKMRAGLTRQQAVNVIKRQRAYDASDIGKTQAARAAHHRRTSTL